MRDRYGNEIDTPSIDPYGGQGAFRGARGWVKQAGKAPQHLIGTNLNQAQVNAAPVDWRGSFNKTSVPAPPKADSATAPAWANFDPVSTNTPKPLPTPVEQFRAQFASNGQPARPASPQPFAPSINPLATTPALHASPLPPAAVGNKPDLTPVSVNYGTVAPTHDWQQGITYAHPSIGQDTPANKAFIAAFQQHNDPARARDTADEVMKGFDERGQPLPGLVNERQPNRIDPYALN